MLSFFILNLFFVTTTYSKYNCNLNQTVYLSIGEIAFFETPNFPELPDSNDCSFGNLTFILKEDNEQNYTEVNLMLAATYINFWNLKAATDFLIFNTNSFSLGTFSSIEDASISAVQGYIIFENVIQNCPLESATKPFNFIDETQILFLHAKYPNITSDSEETRIMFIEKVFCEWSFTAPQGYGFKVVVTKFGISSETDFFVTNSTDIVMNKRSVELFHAVYNNDRVIKVYLSKREKEFELYVSVVKTNAKIIDGNCTFDNSSNKMLNETYFWGSNDVQHKGYYNNIQCSYNCTLKNNTELVVEVDVMATEMSVDTLTYYTGDGKNGTIQVQTDPKKKQVLTFSFHQKFVFFKFQTDGSVEDGGFNLRFSIIGCECNDPPVIPCPSSDFPIMKPSDYGYHGLICSTLHCKFVIEPCNTSLSHLIINNLKNYYYNADYNLIYKVFSNNITVFDFMTWQPSIYEIFLNTSNENIVEIHTFPDDIHLDSSIQLYPFQEPEIDQHILLSFDKNEIDIDLGFTNYTVIEMSESVFIQNVYFVVYGTYEDLDTIIETSPILRNNETLSSNLFDRKYCLFYIDSFKCEIKEKKFVTSAILYNPYPKHISGSHLSVRLSNLTNGCVFDENVFIRKNATNFSVAALSKKSDTCIIKILIGNVYLITHLFTTSENENIQVFAGTDFKNLLFEFNSKSVHRWKDVLLLSHLYVIKIPKGSVLFFKLLLNEASNVPIINIAQFPYQSIITTYGYGTSKTGESCVGVFDSFVEYNIGNCSLKFTVLQYEMDKSEMIQFVGDSDLPVTKIGESFIFKEHTTVHLSIFCSDAETLRKSKMKGILLYLETIQEN